MPYPPPNTPAKQTTWIRKFSGAVNSDTPRHDTPYNEMTYSSPGHTHKRTSDVTATLNTRRASGSTPISVSPTYSQYSVGANALMKDCGYPTWDDQHQFVIQLPGQQQQHICSATSSHSPSSACNSLTAFANGNLRVTKCPAAHSDITGDKCCQYATVRCAQPGFSLAQKSAVRMAQQQQLGSSRDEFTDYYALDDNVRDMARGPAAGRESQLDQ